MMIERGQLKMMGFFTKKESGSRWHHIFFVLQICFPQQFFLRFSGKPERAYADQHIELFNTGRNPFNQVGQIRKGAIPISIVQNSSSKLFFHTLYVYKTHKNLFSQTIV